jgi:hypothetical protein
MVLSALVVSALAAAPAPVVSKADVRKKKAAVEARGADLVSLADQIWGLAETALRCAST